MEARGGGEGVTDWLANDTLFRAEVRQGHEWEDWYAERLRGYGITVEQAAHTVRDDVADRDSWRGEIDMVANGVRLEVKTSRYNLGRFYGKPLNVCSERAWRAKNTTVGIWVVVSRLEDSVPRVRACSGRTVSAHGISTTSSDSVRGMESYSVVKLPWDRWVDEGTLIHWLQSRGAP